MDGLILVCSIKVRFYDKMRVLECLLDKISDDLDFDEDGAVHKRGSARLETAPNMHQWGPRCLSITIRASKCLFVVIHKSMTHNLLLDEVHFFP